jgi:hypothetical protein
VPTSSHLPAPDSPEYQAFARFARLTARKRHLNAELREIEPQLKALQPVLLGFLGEGAFQLVQVEGFTMSPVRDPWVYPRSGVDRQTVCEALKLSGLGRMVKEGYSTRTLTAYVKELEMHAELVAGADPDALAHLLPTALASVLDVRPGYRVQVLDRRTDKSYENQINITEEEGEYADDLEE